MSLRPMFLGGMPTGMTPGTTRGMTNGISDMATAWQASMPSMATWQGNLEMPQIKMPQMPAMGAQASSFDLPKMPEIGTLFQVARMPSMSVMPGMPTMPAVSLDLPSFAWTNAAPEKGASTVGSPQIQGNPSTFQGNPSTEVAVNTPSETRMPICATCTGEDETGSSHETDHEKPDKQNEAQVSRHNTCTATVDVKKAGDKNKESGESEIFFHGEILFQVGAHATLIDSHCRDSDKGANDEALRSRKRESLEMSRESVSPPHRGGDKVKEAKKKTARALAALEQRIVEQNKKGGDTVMTSLVEQLQEQVQQLRSDNK